MKRILLTLAASLLAGTSQAGTETYTIDQAHSLVGFSIRHFFSNTSGRFSKYEGTLKLDQEKLEKSKVEVSIDAASINTENEKRDKHLRSADFFDTDKYPKITFKSTAVRKIDEKKYAVDGKLTIRNKTKPVTLDVEVLGFGADPFGGYQAGFHAKTKINRKDFDVTWNTAWDQNTMLGDEVTIDLNIAAVRSGPEGNKKVTKK